MRVQWLREYPSNAVVPRNRVTGIWFHFSKGWDERQCWFGRTGLGFGGSESMYNAHFYDLFKRPMDRYSDGERRWRFFFGQLARGLREFVRG